MEKIEKKMDNDIIYVKNVVAYSLGHMQLLKDKYIDLDFSKA